MAGESKTPILRKMSIHDRREYLSRLYQLTSEELNTLAGAESCLEIADIMVENAVGVTPVPLGITESFSIDDEQVSVPLATEEPSIIAAASYAAGIISSFGGFSTWADAPIMTAQLHVHKPSADWEKKLALRKNELIILLVPSLQKMKARGGGFQSLTWTTLPTLDVLRIDIDVDVRDAMGANLLNTAAEAVKPLVEEISGGKVILAVLTNSSGKRKAGAEFKLPVGALGRAGRGTFAPREIASRIVMANRIAAEDPDRAVTHNKGIMNGISALALATGNDSRAIEAAAHAWASTKGKYGPLTEYYLEKDILVGRIESPLPFAVIGGGIQYHPAYSAAIKILGSPNAARLSRIAAALGLAQNFAALLALVTTGIQAGHMRLHRKRSEAAADV
jgi:hydroxymethylglutaryl-CoA reductase